ncbi:hypothetical protein BDK51DRAFT_5627, partial [Blyttiomyces helicus]
AMAESTSRELDNLRIAKLTDKNYHDWKFDVKLVLEAANLSGTYTDTLEEWEAKDRKAFIVIALNGTTDQKVHVRNAKSSKEAWENLEKVHEA